MVLVRASVGFEGFKGKISGVALVDTGSALTLLDRSIADRIGTRTIGRRVKIIVADGHEIFADLAIVNKVVVEGEELPGAHVGLMDFPEKLAKRLRELNLSEWCVIGMSTLEILGLFPNTLTGKVEKGSALLI
ncbi:MAG: aspartyl protease family protein [Candidatus Baldrarchaeia archaeon]